MIIQALLDMLTELVLGFFVNIPPLPQGFTDVLNMIGGAADTISASIAALAPIIPFDVIRVCLGIYVGLLGLWGAVALLRLGFWAFGR